MTKKSDKISGSVKYFMLFENQVCKQSQDQPVYIKNPFLLEMQRSSMVRYERSTNLLHLLPPFFVGSSELITFLKKIFENQGIVQQIHFNCANDAEFASYVSGMVRSVKSLPMILKIDPSVSINTRSSILGSRTTYDAVYYQFSGIDPIELFQNILVFCGKWKIIKFSAGLYIIDTSIPCETEIQKENQYQVTPIPEKIDPIHEIHTPNAHTIDELSIFTGRPATELIKAVMYQIGDQLVFVNIRGDLEVSEDKLRHFLGYSNYQTEIQLASPSLLEKHGLVAGFAGLVGIKRASECIIICDESVKTVHSGVTGANKVDYHFNNFNILRDAASVIKFIKYADVASNVEKIQGAIVAEVDFCLSYLPEFLGNDSKPSKYPMFKYTFRIIDMLASILSEHKLQGAYVINMCKNDAKLNNTLVALQSVYSSSQIIIDNRPKANFGTKMDSAKLSSFKYVIIASTKTDDDSVTVNDVPVKIADIPTIVKQ